MKKSVIDRVPKKKTTLKIKKTGKKEKLQSEYYPLMKFVAFIIFIIMIIIGSMLLYDYVNFFGIDISGQITSAAVVNVTPP